MYSHINPQTEVQKNENLQVQVCHLQKLQQEGDTEMNEDRNVDTDVLQSVPFSSSHFTINRNVQFNINFILIIILRRKAGESNCFFSGEETIMLKSICCVILVISLVNSHVTSFASGPCIIPVGVLFAAVSSSLEIIPYLK